MTNLEVQIRNTIALIQCHTQWDGKDPSEDMSKDLAAVTECLEMAREMESVWHPTVPHMWWGQLLSLLSGVQFRVSRGIPDNVLVLLGEAADLASQIDAEYRR